MLKNTDSVGDILFRGSTVLKSVQDQLTAASVDMSTTQVTELAFELEDAGFALLSKGVFDIDTPVTYRGLKLTIAVQEVTTGGGLGGLSIKCRPDAVRSLKNLRGKRVTQGLSPSQYVQSECDLVGVTCHVEPSTAKKNIARDVVQKGQDYDNTNYPSAWTTFQRLATEVGYLMYEVGGIIYFGKPTWLVENNPKVAVNWYPVDGTEPYSIPTFRNSVDSKDIEFSLELPLSRAGEVFPGYGITISGFPKYEGTYLITQVSYPLAGQSGTVSISASTVRNPKAQKSGQQE